MRLNALKQTITLAVNLAAATLFLFSKRIAWTPALVMLAFTLVGGVLGGAVASRIPTRALRILIVVGGVGVSIVYFARW